ncbi:DNA primase large subunit-like isoform X1 [Photinus pyralis]|nr:DNA primase large subunit-like isoform X1 [Photinus pyralis]
MTFYLKPPRGTIEFHILEKCVEQRLKFYKNATNTNDYLAEYLLEDSALDRAGHFTLRLAAVHNETFSPVFVHSEVHLLRLRLRAYNAGSTHKFLRRLLRHSNEFMVELGGNEEIASFLNTLINVAMKMSSRSYRAHTFDAEHCSNDRCKLFELRVPFQHCPSMISRREVPLHNGYLRVPCEKWCQLILALYDRFLCVVLRGMRFSRSVLAALDDHRVQSILGAIQSEESFEATLTFQRFEVEKRRFPLCMGNLQHILRKNHRLSHDARFNYSLFLKDIGMSFEDSVTFWKSEYSKDGSNCQMCSHSWQRDEKRYVYSIRHLYGLAGSRKNYKSRSCDYFQRSLISATEEAVCPFRHFDERNLKMLLSTLHGLEADSEITKSILLERVKNSSSACKLFMKIAGDVSNQVLDSHEIISPVHYFNLFPQVSS